MLLELKKAALWNKKIALVNLINYNYIFKDALYKLNILSWFITFNNFKQ